MQRHDLTITPTSDFEVPYSDGYSVYTALIQALNDKHPEIAPDAVSRPAAFQNSGVTGHFGDADGFNKRALADRTYELTVGIPADTSALSDALESVTSPHEELKTPTGSFEITDRETSQQSYEELGADLPDDPSVTFDFKSPVVIPVSNTNDAKATARFPAAFFVFRSLRRKWNHHAPDDASPLTITDGDIEKYIATSSHDKTVPPYNVVVDKRQGDTGTENVYKHGFGGLATYTTLKAPDNVVRDAVRLSRFAKFSGVGIARDRGCGTAVISIE